MNIGSAEFWIALVIGFIAGAVALWTVVKSRMAAMQVQQERWRDIENNLAVATKHIELLKEQLETSQTKITLVQAEKETYGLRAATLHAENKALETKLANMLEERTALENQFRKEFENLANRIFEGKAEKFAKQNFNSLDGILTPLKERIQDFQKRIEETHTSSVKETTGLREELRQLKDMSQRMTTEAENLTRALKNDSKAQGNWGEIILESILENSGLEKGREYVVQKSYTSADGKRFQPDVVIQLPENKSIIVDSKVSLTHYERFSSETDEKEKEAQLKNHLVSMRTHIKALADKNYHELPSGSNLDFILMFVPVEPAYLIALNREPSLFNEAYEKGIVMVSPTTLVASLKIIASTWKYERQNKNALEISNRGKLLLEKFVGFTEDLERIGEHLSKSDRAYQEAIKKLRDGKGNLISQAQQLEDLGVKSSKQIPDSFTNLLSD